MSFCTYHRHCHRRRRCRRHRGRRHGQPARRHAHGRPVKRPQPLGCRESDWGQRLSRLRRRAAGMEYPPAAGIGSASSTCVPGCRPGGRDATGFPPSAGAQCLGAAASRWAADLAPLCPPATRCPYMPDAVTAITGVSVPTRASPPIIGMVPPPAPRPPAQCLSHPTESSSTPHLAEPPPPRPPPHRAPHPAPASPLPPPSPTSPASSSRAWPAASNERAPAAQRTSAAHSKVSLNRGVP